MKKKLVFLLVFLLIFGNGVSVFAVTQSQVDQESAQIQNLKSEISRLDTQINGYETQINTLNSQIESTNQQLLQAQQQEEQMVDESEKRMKAAYMYGDTGYLEYLFSADSPSDFISYFDITREIVTDDKARVNEIKQKKTEIQNLQNQLTNQRAQVLGVKQQSETLRTQKEQTLTQNQATLAQLQQQLSQQQLDANARTSPTTPVASVPVTLTNNINVLANGNAEPKPLTSASAQPAEQQTEEVTTTTTTTEDSAAEAPATEEQSAQSDNQQYIVTQTTTVTESSGGEETVTSQETNQTTVSGSQYLPSYIQDLLGLPDTVSTNNPTNSNTPTTVAPQFSGSWVWPLDVTDPNAFTITSTVGHRDSPGGVGSTNHQGTDIGASYGTAILAASAGTVTTAGTYGGYGNCVMIDHGNGYTTIYGHMSSVAVNTGDVVTAGQVIGFVGSTGWSTGPHLHFEVRYDENGNTTIIDGLTLYDSNITSRLRYAE